MFIYNVTINVEDSVAEEWLEWMITSHVPDVLKTGCFTENKIFRVLVDEDNGGKTYSIQYYCKDMKTFEHYEKTFAPALRAQVSEKYKDKFVAFRTMLEVIK